MPGPTGGLIKAAAILLLTLAVAACQAERPPLGPPGMGFSTIRNLGEAPVKGASVTVAFLTLTGVPGQARFDMEKSLRRWAETRKLRIFTEDNATATYRVRGYLSALGDQNGTLLVYTWDVYDNAGRPLHRISGQETAEGSQADPWAAITKAKLDDAARETIDKLADWVGD